jgi:hypothetical protein
LFAELGDIWSFLISLSENDLRPGQPIWIFTGYPIQLTTGRQQIAGSGRLVI